jgi:cell division transport system permease protein
MFGRRPAMPLQDNGANRFLPWIVGLMVFLAALALAGMLALDSAVARWRGGHGDTLTVQVPPTGDGEKAPQIRAALEALRAEPEVAAARLLERDELVALVEPWLGKGNVAPDLPLPWLIDVRLAPGATPDLDALQARLSKVAPGAAVDDHRVWLDRLAAAARTLQGVTLAVVLAIGAASAGTVVFTTRTNLAVHQDEVELLHHIGARDAFIARAFAWQALRLGLRGGLLGLGLAVVTLAVVRHFTEGVEAPLLPQPHLDLAALGAIVALPAASALIAMVTARVTVMRALARMP